jgi:hypothetical protein
MQLMKKQNYATLTQVGGHHAHHLLLLLNAPQQRRKVEVERQQV